MLSDAVVLAAKDLRIELRSPSSAVGAVTLGLIGLVVTGLATGPDPARLRTIAPGLAWLAVVYAAIAVSDRLDRVDRDDDAFSDLWLSVRDRRAIFVGKVFALTLILWTITLALLVAAVDPPQRRAFAGCGRDDPSRRTGLSRACRRRRARDGRRGVELQADPPPAGRAPPAPRSDPACRVPGTAALLDGRLDAALPWVGLLATQAALFAGVGLLVYDAGAALE